MDLGYILESKKTTCSQWNVIAALWSPSPNVDGIKCSGIFKVESGLNMIGRSLSLSNAKLLALDTVGISSRTSLVGLHSEMYCFDHLPSSHSMFSSFVGAGGSARRFKSYQNSPVASW